MTQQVYLFSFICLTQVGIRLSYDNFGVLLKLDKIFQEKFIKNNTLSTFFAVGAVLLGVVLLFQRPVDSKDYVFLLGDIVPALLGILGGGAQLLTIIKKGYSGENKYILGLQRFVKTNIAVIGLLMIVIAIVHAIFPEPVFL